MKQMKKMSKTYYAILGMLSISPMSGYEIRQIMRQSTSNFWSESDGQLYPALLKLTKEGYLTCKVADKNALREKKIYRLTTKGTTELNHWLGQEPETMIVRSEFMLQLFFGANVSTKISIEHVRAHRSKTKSMLIKLAETKKKLERDHDDSPHLPFWKMSIDYGIELGEAKVKWCDKVLATLEKM